MEYSDDDLPVAKGDWVESRENTPRVGRVRDSYWGVDDGNRVCLIDVVLFDHSGDKIGRTSPAMGGTRTCEPAVNYSDWMRIVKPEFPVVLSWVDDGSGGRVAGYVTNAPRLPDRLPGTGKKSTSRSSRPRRGTDTDYDPEIEVRARRMAAQQLRDINRASSAPALVEKAEKLESEARRIALEHGMEK